MTWKFHVHATEQRRLFSRILQVLESQMVNIHSFGGEANDAGVCVTVVFSSEQDKAYRIEALLHRLEDVRSVSIQDTEWKVFPRKRTTVRPTLSEKGRSHLRDFHVTVYP